MQRNLTRQYYNNKVQRDSYDFQIVYSRQEGFKEVSGFGKAWQAGGLPNISAHIVLSDYEI